MATCRLIDLLLASRYITHQYLALLVSRVNSVDSCGLGRGRRAHIAHIFPVRIDTFFFTTAFERLV